MTEPVVWRFAALVALVIGVAGAAFLVATPWLRRKPELWQEVGLRIVAWGAIAGLLIGAAAAPRTAWVVVLGVLSLLVFREYARAVGLWKDRSFLAIGYGFLIVLHVIVWWPYPDFFDGPGWYGLFLVMPVWGIVFLLLVPILRDRSQHMLRDIALMMIGMVYFGFFLAHFAYMRNLTGGVGLALWLGFLVAINDVSAFIGGKLLGRHKLRPTLSPGKTWEGAAVSLVVVVAVAWGLQWLVPRFEAWQVLVASVIVSIAAVVGDLTTSVIKRDLGIKDWSQALPGHGGLLDRANSLIYAAPIVFHLTVFWFGL